MASLHEQPAVCEPSSAETSSTPEAPAEAQLPPLSAADFRTFNILAVKMDSFHNHFRKTWTMLHTAATSNKRPQGMSIRQFLSEGLSFIQHLEAHHSIEENYFFPQLARKMPEFRGGKAELLRQHREIHKGMEGLQTYLRACRAGEVELQMSVLLEQLDSWGGVLWTHLDQEVKTLGAENMRRYWTLADMKGFMI
ncbi:hypothetical protein ACHAPP_003300 [Verticillium nonalfalfae]